MGLCCSESFHDNLAITEVKPLPQWKMTYDKATFGKTVSVSVSAKGMPQAKKEYKVCLYYSDQNLENLVAEFDPSYIIKDVTGNPFESEYELLSSLGSGIYGEVKKAKHRGSGQIRAIKVIPKKSEEGNYKLVNEIQMLKRLDHPYILRMYEFYQDANAFYIVEDYCAGGDLLSKIGSEDLWTGTKLLIIARQILSALAYLHNVGIVHRDLKPENIGLAKDSLDDDNLEVKMLDFGVSSRILPQQFLKDQIGSASYVAPEVLHHQYSEKCDIWSAGVILFYLFGKSPPFSGSSKEEIFRKIEMGQFHFSTKAWTLVGPEIKDLVTKMLTLKPEERISANAALTHPFFQSAPLQLPTKYSASRVRDQAISKPKHTIFQRMIMTYVAHNLLPVSELEELKSLFLQFDVDCDGKISESDLMCVMGKVFPDGKERNKEVLNILAKVDINMGKAMSYSDFLAIMCNLNSDQLDLAFQYFDNDRDNEISPLDLLCLFQKYYTKIKIEQIIAEAAEPKKITIPLARFMTVMEPLLALKR